MHMDLQTHRLFIPVTFAALIRKLRAFICIYESYGGWAPFVPRSIYHWPDNIQNLVLSDLGLMAHKCLTSPQTSFPQQNTNQTALFLTRILRTAYIKTIICTRTSKSTDSPIPASKRSLSNPSSSCKIDFKLPLVPTTTLLLSQDLCLLIRVASASVNHWRSGKKSAAS